MIKIYFAQYIVIYFYFANSYFNLSANNKL